MDRNLQQNSRVVLAKDFFLYQKDFLSLAPAANATGTVNIQADSDFELQKLTYQADFLGASQTESSRVIPMVSIQITDTGSGRNLLESQAPITNMFGTGERPFILPQPKIFAARSTITLTVTNFDAVMAYNLRLSLIGRKIFYRG